MRVLATGHLFVSGYVVLLALFGVIPVIYSLYLALTTGRRVRGPR